MITDDSRLWIVFCVSCLICACAYAGLTSDGFGALVLGLSGVLCAGIAYYLQAESDEEWQN